jgi:hypothetical protein
MIVAVVRRCATVALVALGMSSEKTSSPSARVSLLISTGIVFTVSPGANTSVSARYWKSALPL